ncbi:FAD-dependent monooxygenase [Aquamicrobium ahrensii]|uniref:Salicylate hydroxylase n=1 Tax=Aquamicrobium ahrensii TaxID=469551 RepID=A0ABV2KG50_9HYPH
MKPQGARPILIAGAGIAGLTLAIALARRGIASQLYEQAPQLEAFGAGLQLSPNATHILAELGVLSCMRSQAVQPKAVRLKDARTLRVLTSVPLGQAAERRWEAPYLVAHRADLQQALLAEVATWAEITLTSGMRLSDISETAEGDVRACFESEDGRTEVAQSSLLIGADGVWSRTRQHIAGSADSRFSGQIAWRATIMTDSDAGQAFRTMAETDCVTTFLHGDFHLVAYPLRAGAEINLVAFTPADKIADSWATAADPAILMRALTRGSARLLALAGLVRWTAWPLNTVDPAASWSAPGMVLIGDAAHAVTPFAAQGAAMAIEDAALLAHSLATAAGSSESAISAWEAQRKARLTKVARRGALNKLAWNATGPIALARNLVLSLRSPESLAADLDWLYGWRLPQQH